MIRRVRHIIPITKDVILFFSCMEARDTVYGIEIRNTIDPYTWLMSYWTDYFGRVPFSLKLFCRNKNLLSLVTIMQIYLFLENCSSTYRKPGVSQTNVDLISFCSVNSCSTLTFESHSYWLYKMSRKPSCGSLFVLDVIHRSYKEIFSVLLRNVMRISSRCKNQCIKNI